MKFKRKLLVLFCIIAVIISNFTVFYVFADDDCLYLGGIPAGFTVKTEGATVIGLTDVITENEVVSPAKNGDIRIGDVILSVAGKRVDGVEAISDALNDCKGNPVEITLDRGGQKISKFISPRKDSSGNYKLGLFLREDLSGIGTITYFKQNGDFAALGHPILSDDGKILSVNGGNCYLCSIIGVTKGEKGKAGELKGIFIEDKPIGKILKNVCTGLYGKAENSYNYKKRTKVMVGKGTVGNAAIIVCVDGVTPKEYSICIAKCDLNNKENKNFVIKITDKALLNATNGILQGMSGSPIVQNGKIVGAVTHVFINDPTRGFGIDVAKMLENQRR